MPRLTRALLKFLVVPAAVVLLVALVIDNPQTAGGAASAVFSCAPPATIKTFIGPSRSVLLLQIGRYGLCQYLILAMLQS